MAIQTSAPTVTAEVAELFPSQGEWTEPDYFSLPETNRFLELSDGVLVMPPHPTYSHQSALQRLFVALQRFVEERELGVVLIAPIPTRLWPGKIREPDVLFFANEHRDRIAESAVGVPDLAVEVISASTAKTDRTEKFSEYASAGVAEYWLLDPQARTVEVYVLRRGAYMLRGDRRREGIATSALLAGFEVDVSRLFEG